MRRSSLRHLWRPCCAPRRNDLQALTFFTTSSASTVAPTLTVTATVTAATATATATGAAVFPLPTTGRVPLDCPRLTGSRQTIVLGERAFDFETTCGLDWASVGGADVVAVIAYSLRDCMQACASYNRNGDLRSGVAGGGIGTARERCVAVTFNSDLDSISLNYGTCWLKNSTTLPVPGGPNTYAGAALVAAR